MEINISNSDRKEKILPKSEEEFIVPYFEDYDDKKMWMSYWYQIKEVLQTNGEKILIVGVGNKTVSNYLKTISQYLEHKKINVTTADIDENLNPDKVCNVTELSECFKPNTFDTILCAEVLEHLSFEKFEKALKELHKVSKKWVILSLPYSGSDFKLSLELPQRSEKTLSLKFPSKKEHKYDGWHHWEIGKKKYSREKIRKILKKRFKIVRNYSPPENTYHLFYVLKK